MKRLFFNILIVLIMLGYPLLIWLGHGRIDPQLFELLSPLKLYPVLINIIMLIIFGYSLITPPSIIERIARLREPDLPPIAIIYTRRVTQIWCVFFVINGSIALGTVFWASPAIWSLYNGVISYIFMGLLFGGEYLVRGRFKRRHRV
jgi:uncharacterized membrane protein